MNNDGPGTFNTDHVKKGKRALQDLKSVLSISGWIPKQHKSQATEAAIEILISIDTLQSTSFTVTFDNPKFLLFPGIPLPRHVTKSFWVKYIKAKNTPN